MRKIDGKTQQKNWTYLSEIICLECELFCRMVIRRTRPAIVRNHLIASALLISIDEHLDDQHWVV